MNKAIIGCVIVVGVTVVAGLKARIKKSKAILAEKPVCYRTPNELHEAAMVNIRAKYPAEVAEMFDAVGHVVKDHTLVGR